MTRGGADCGAMQGMHMVRQTHATMTRSGTAFSSLAMRCLRAASVASLVLPEGLASMLSASALDLPTAMRTCAAFARAC